MLISIDGQEYSEPAVQGQTLDELVKKVRASLADSGRMIVAIECDGQVLDADQVNNALAEQADRYGRVNFQTSAPGDLAGDALGAMKGLLDEAGTLTTSAAELLNQSQIKQSMQQIARLCACWNDVYRGVLNTLRLLAIDPAGIELSTGTAATTMAHLPDRLREVKTCLENQDYTQLADVLSYELGPSVNDWRGIVDSLLTRIDENQS